MPFVMVPQKNVFVLERLGKYARTLDPGLHFKIPVMDAISYHHSLKEQVLAID